MASLARSIVLCSSVFAALIGSVQANAFRGNGGFMAAVGHMDAEALRAAVLEEVMGALGSGNRVTEQRLQAIEEVLRPTFAAMPKNAHGNLDHASARYVLHRLFVQRHAMYVKGLQPGSEAWSDSSNSSATEVMEDRVPAFVQSLFEERLKGRGLGMHELAVLAATLEHLIHDEAVERLKVVYEAHSLPLDARVGETAARQVIDTYMMLFILGRNASEVTAELVAQEQATIEKAYPGWHETQKFAHQVRSGLVASKSAEPDFAGGQLTFQAASQVVEEIGERYGRWQDAECQDLKGALVKLENRGSGRVLLKDFYGQALSGGAWQFSESMDYLRELGALDESDPQQPAVMIANYVNAKSNCLASSSIYSVCCINECDALMGQLEREVAAPEALPGRILELVAQLPSATVAAPREITQELRSRLEEVAGHHGGSVPLHGRLFAQWLHHAYPRECPYPHVAGSTNPMTSKEWMANGADSTSASVEEMSRHVQREEPAAEQAAPIIRREKAAANEQVSLPWTMEEELLVSKSSKKPAGWSWSRTLAFVVAVGSTCVALGRSASSAPSSLGTSSAKDGLLPFHSKQHIC